LPTNSKNPRYRTDSPIESNFKVDATEASKRPDRRIARSLPGSPRATTCRRTIGRRIRVAQSLPEKKLATIREFFHDNSLF
jgi:hypothetical protein